MVELQARLQALEAENQQLHGRVRVLEAAKEKLDNLQSHLQKVAATSENSNKTLHLRVDHHGRVTPHNELAAQIFAEETGPLREYIHPVFQAGYDQALAQARHTAAPQVLDALVVCHAQTSLFAHLTITHTAVGDADNDAWDITMSPITPDHTIRFLSSGEASYRDIADLTGSYAYGIIITETGQLVLEWVTDGFTQLTGYEVSDLLQWPEAQKIIHPDDLPNLLERIVGWHKGQANEGEYRLHTRDGRTIWIRDRVQPIWDAERERVVRLYSLGQEITDRKEAELALAESQERYQQLIESTFDLVQVVNLEGRFQLVNQAWQDTLGYTAEEWPQLTIWDILHPDEHEHCQQLLAQVLAGHYLPRLQTRMVTKHGRVLHMNGSITPNFDHQQNIIGSNGFFHDITEQVVSAEALRQYTNRLEMLRAIDRAIVTAESIADIVQSALQYLRSMLVCDRISIILFNDQQEAELYAYEGREAGNLDTATSVRQINRMLAYAQDTPHGCYLLPNFAEATDLNTVPALDELQRAGYQTYLGVPLHADDETLGVLNVTHTQPHYFDAEAINIAREVADHLAIALRQAKLYEATQNQLKELQVLHAVAQACAEAETEDALVCAITKLIYGYDLAELFELFLLDPHEKQLHIHPAHADQVESRGLPPIALGMGLTGRVAADKRARYVPNTAVDPAYLDLGRVMGSELCVPLISNGRVLGVLNAERKAVHSFDPFAQRLLTTISGQLSVTIERLRSEQNTQRYAQQIISMNEMAQKVTRSLELDQVLQGIIDEVSALVEAEGVAVLLRLDNEEHLEFAAVSGPGARGLQHQTMPADRGVAGLVLRHGKPIAIYDRRQMDDAVYQQAEDMSGFHSQSLLAVPIIVDNYALGVLEAVHSQPRHFPPDALNLLSAAATWAAIALQNAQLFAQLGEQYQQLQRSQAQLIQAEKLSALGRLVASIAHEINNPIQAIQGCLTLATEELAAHPAPPDERHAVNMYLGIVQDELVRVASIVKRMRDFYRPAQEGQYPTDVVAILHSVLELSQKQLEYAQVQVNKKWSADLPLVFANPNHLKQVFLNLLLNAVDAMPDGGQLTIETRHATAEEETELGHTAVVIRLQDTGHGIPANELAHLFEPFFTTKDEGSGLGLSISYNIIQAHNGRLLVDSLPGQGTTFTILLPAHNPNIL